MRYSPGRQPISSASGSVGARRSPLQPEGWPGDERAAARFAAGEPGSLELIVRHYAGELFPLAARLAGPEAGETLLLEAFFRALSSRARYRGDPPLGEWLRRLVEESGKGRPRPVRSGTEETAPPFALASRLISRLEEKASGSGMVLGRLGILSRRARLMALAGAVAMAAAWVLVPRPPASRPSEGEGAVPVFFDSSSVVREAVTPPGRIPVVTLHGPAGYDPGWRLPAGPRPRRIPSALTSLYRLTLASTGRVTSVERRFSVPSVPPSEVEELLKGLVFEPVPGRTPSPSVEVRVVAE